MPHQSKMRNRHLSRRYRRYVGDCSPIGTSCLVPRVGNDRHRRERDVVERPSQKPGKVDIPYGEIRMTMSSGRLTLRPKRRSRVAFGLSLIACTQARLNWQRQVFGLFAGAEARKGRLPLSRGSVPQVRENGHLWAKVNVARSSPSKGIVVIVGSPARTNNPSTRSDQAESVSLH